MVYEIIISPTAEKDLKKFNRELQKRFFKKIDKLKDSPDIHGKPLRKPLAGKWEIRFEKRWRIVYRILEENKVVEIIAIWHKDEF
ncbi:MAG: type II toxin-antitoxin system mRNA interferase toxin, RelE/StbE family [Candidatus Altiarchaeales archaeon]|nr:type II toxin-antitoxin system mRNA interferase toxin, RelE/StbE family [Candidatus Altiarchaeales archaeon]